MLPYVTVVHHGNPARSMSVVGQDRLIHNVRAMSASPPITTGSLFALGDNSGQHQAGSLVRKILERYSATIMWCFGTRHLTRVRTDSRSTATPGRAVPWRLRECFYMHDIAIVQLSDITGDQIDDRLASTGRVRVCHSEKDALSGLAIS